MHIETKCLHEGYKPGNGEPKALPIYQSTTYTYDSTEHVGAAVRPFGGTGHMYSRISNPTVAAVEQKIAALEGGVGALCTTSGQAASLLAVLNICTGGRPFCRRLHHLRRHGEPVCGHAEDSSASKCTFVDADAAAGGDPKRRSAPTQRRCSARPSPTRPSLCWTSKSSRASPTETACRCLWTTPSPRLCCAVPLSWGADIVVHSTTKYMDGHAIQVGGVIVDCGNFDWENGKFPRAVHSRTRAITA